MSALLVLGPELTRIRNLYYLSEAGEKSRTYADGTCTPVESLRFMVGVGKIILSQYCVYISIRGNDYWLNDKQCFASSVTFGLLFCHGLLSQGSL